MPTQIRKYAPNITAEECSNIFGEKASTSRGDILVGNVPTCRVLTVVGMPFNPDGKWIQCVRAIEFFTTFTADAGYIIRYCQYPEGALAPDRAYQVFVTTDETGT